MAIEKILVIDDEPIIRTFLEQTLHRLDLEVSTAQNGKEAFQLLKENAYDIVFTDMKMPDKNGLEILEKVKEFSPETLVVIVTGFGTIENAVETIKKGAYHYLLKPFSADTIEALIEKIKEHKSLLVENQYLRQQVNLTEINGKERVIAENPIMKQIFAEVKQIATSNASIFIQGESGTGKEVVAHMIHNYSSRANRPFIKINCAAVPETLVESEFFGHEKGSFTGASARRIGRFELANTGTILLDEITEIPSSLQAKFLRVTQDQVFERVGGTKSIKVDVRIISTTNRDIQEILNSEIIRKDLYYRLSVIPITLPPLRDRLEDIIPLAEYFLEKMCIENHKKSKIFSKEALEKLTAYSWPGNIRELANIVERTVVLDTSSTIGPEHLTLEAPPPAAMTLKELEKKLVIETFQKQQKDAEKAAKLLGITPQDLLTKLAIYELDLE